MKEKCINIVFEKHSPAVIKPVEQVSFLSEKSTLFLMMNSTMKKSNVLYCSLWALLWVGNWKYDSDNNKTFTWVQSGFTTLTLPWQGFITITFFAIKGSTKQKKQHSVSLKKSCKVTKCNAKLQFSLLASLNEFERKSVSLDCSLQVHSFF